MACGGASTGPTAGVPVSHLVAAAAVVLLLTGIHNAWDTVTNPVFVQRPRKPEE